jgi:transcriptional regulator with XRE-family HTH domain
MADLTRKQKQELAKLLYTRGGFSQKEVAQKVGVTEATMSKWANGAEKWELLKTSITATREEQLRRFYLQLGEYNTAIEAREKGKRYPSATEADAMNKVAAAIEKLERETGAVDILNVSKKMLDWIRTFDLPKAQELSDLFDAFLKDNLR